jgi:hypothetical protein
MGKHSVRTQEQNPTPASDFDAAQVVEAFGRETKTHRKQSGRRRASMAAVAVAGLLFSGSFLGGEDKPATNTTASENLPSNEDGNSGGSENEPTRAPETALASLACDLSGVGMPEDIEGGKFYGLTLTNAGDSPEGYKIGTYVQGGQLESSTASLGVYNADEQRFDSSVFEPKGANEELGVVVPSGLFEDGKSLVIYAEKGDETELCGGLSEVDGAINFGSNPNDYPANPNF